MTVDRIVFAVAGTLVLLSVLLTLTVSTWFLAIAGFVGTNMLQSAFTKFCPLAVILRRAGVTDSVH
ncbi:MAG TPA: DUF2892 domain-containing protein [Polyangia bacterium]|jgi:ABC-type transport system involved in cytochrome bd biosynthesis fused ATPase/permease subunit